MTKNESVIHKRFALIAASFPDKVALQIKKDDYWQHFTYKQADELRRKVAAFLLKQGFKKGDFACLILENRPEWPVIYLGILSAGLACVPLNPDLCAQEIKNLVSDSQAKIIFTSYEVFFNKIKQIAGGLAIKTVILDKEDEFKYVSLEGVIFPEVLPQDTASLIYTSGTTALPKGVLLSHRNLCANFDSLNELKLLSSSDNVLAILPLYHSYAFMVTLIVPLFLGAKVTYCASFKPQDLNQILQEAKVTVLTGVPQFFSLLHRAILGKIGKIPFIFIKGVVRKRFSALRLLVSGGARLTPKVGRDLTRLGFKLIEGYGLTETSPVVTLSPLLKVKIGSVGKPIPGVEIKIFDPDKSGIGQVLIKGQNVMEGYFKRPDLTGQAVKDGWLYTGDFGYFDKGGYLFLVGRKEEIIVLASGKNIYPEELEEYYGKSPYIKEICIIPRQEESFGSLKESLFAVIVPKLDALAAKDRLNLAQKIHWDLENFGKELPAYKHIMGFTLTKDDLPRTALKKIKRYQVAQKYQKEKAAAQIKTEVSLEEDNELTDKEAAAKVMNYISRELKRPVNLGSHLEIDLGIDSLSRVELGLGLEALFKMKIPDKFIYTVSTVKEVVLGLQGLLENPLLRIQGHQGMQKTWGQVLKESPGEQVARVIKLRPAVLDRGLTRVFKKLFLFIFRVFWLLRIEGTGNLPKAGPYLLCPNHASYLDGPVIFSALPFESAMNTFFLGLSYIFGHPSISWAGRIARLIPINASTHLTDAMQAVSYVLSNKKIVCVFPEGMRSIDTKIQAFKKGAGILIKELDIPVVPVYIEGSHYSWPRGKFFPRPYPLKVIFGRPLTRQELGEDYESITSNLREKVIELSRRVVIASEAKQSRF